MSIFSGFIDGLKKSFSGKTYTRKLYTCIICREDSFFGTTICLKCEVDDIWRRSKK